MTSADGTTTTRRPIVAGVDGSESSLAALRWAMRQAELTGAPLEIVSAWEWPVSWGWQAPIPPGYDPADEARRQLDKAISAVLTPGDAIEARRTVIEGNPAPVLEALSKTADLIVIGSHGHGEFAGMLLGSVSQHCITHCHCPVVVIRGTGRRAMPDDEADSSSSSRDMRVNARSVLERLDEAESMSCSPTEGWGGWSSPAGTGPRRCRSRTRSTEGRSSWARGTPSSTRSCARVSRTPTTTSPSRLTRLTGKRARDGSCSCGGRHIIWIPRLSARRSSMPGSNRGSKG